MSDDSADTVIGSCLHCNAPPPPRSSSRGGSTLNTLPCPSTSSSAIVSSGSTPSAATRVQVSCDDCRSFICDGCHWCHEFQANHEIRVCDRCDAFYCRGCDEMDQCEDCSEVVCNTCSTLMSCKFCGCGLCEDCATACGRCGIVLCARDAKFAVECDTCRMSYCLVCLASGTKDPCVRCGHRPSKRVEQLVHLRLKSIYKAFKQSGASMGPGGNNSGSSGGSGGANKGGDGSGRDGNSNAMGGKYSSALRSLTDGVGGGSNNNNSDSSSPNKDNFSNFDQSMASEVAAVLQSASNSMNNSDGGDRRERAKRNSSHDGHGAGGSGNRSSSRSSNAAAERYFRKTQEEMQKAAAAAEAEAEAAAAALLAELDEAENITKSKKSKKKKKKKAQQKKEADEVDELEQQPSNEPTSDTTDNVKSAKDEGDGGKKKGNNAKKKGSNESLTIDDDSSDEEMDFAQLVSGAKGPSGPSKKEKKEEDEKVADPPEPKPESPPPIEETASDAATATFDAELAILLSNDDEDGLETFLSNLKGVPGLGAARKTAKKALKKIRETKKSATPIIVEPEKVVQTQSQNSKAKEVSSTKTKPKKKAKGQSLKERAQAAAAAAKLDAAKNPKPPTPATGNEPLLTIVSRTNIDGTTSNNKGGKSSNSVPGSARAECVMHMSPRVVGWVIGKGGSRIRDMMEESGAKIWIDQESMEESEARVVYVSGKRTSVDTAVKMVKEMVAQSPVPVGIGTAPAQGAAQPAPIPKVLPSTTTTSSSKAKSADLVVPASAAQNPPTVAKTPVVKKEPTSFAAAAGAVSSSTAVTPSGTPTKQQSVQPHTQQSWALPPMASGIAPPPQATVMPRTVQLAPESATSGIVSVSTPIITTVLGCDPRFVALLIGRRGWTVKNIQAESGANLDIDQTVDPPKIIISGKVDNVQKAEQMVRDVLKYPHAQLHQDQQQQPSQQHQMMPDQHSSMSNSSHMPMQTSLRRDVSQESQGALNLPPGYGQYQQQQQQQSQQQNAGNINLFSDSSSGAQSRMSDFLSNNTDQRPPSANPGVQQHHQQDWGGHHHQQQNQAPPPPAPPMRNQFSVALPPFPGSSQGQVSSPRDQQYNNMHSNHPNNAPLGHHSPQHDNRRPSASSFGLPQEQHLHFSPQNHESAPQAQMSPANRLNDFMGGSSNAGHNLMNGWGDLPPAGGSNMGGNGSWNQSQQAPMSHNHQQTGFQQQQQQQQQQQPPASTHPQLSDNPFQQHHAPAPSQPQLNNNTISDDSLMVDNLFASLGAVGGSDADGLLSALDSVSLGGPSQPQQQQQGDANWESKIASWGTEDDSKGVSSFLQGLGR